MGHVRWADIRDKHIEAAGGAEAVERGKNEMLAKARGYRLAELRKNRGLTQRQVAQKLGVTVGRVSQIEKGQVSGIDVLYRYAAALGGEFEMTVNFGEVRFKVS